MKKSVRWLLSAVGALAMMCAGTHAYSATTTTFQANGTSAFSTTCTNNCANALYLDLYSSSSKGTSSWFIFFAVFGSDSSGNPTTIVGSGPIPASMVSGNGNNNLALNLDTNAAGLQVQYCVGDYLNGGTCTPYSGVITATWNTTSLYSQHLVQQDQQTYGSTTVNHQNMQSDVSSATAQTNAFGTQFSDQFGSLGTSHNGSVSITRP